MNIDWQGTLNIFNPFYKAPQKPAPVKSDIASLWDPATNAEFSQTAVFAPFAGKHLNIAESNQAFDTFLDWKKSRDQANQERAQYLQLVQQKPGRSATVLTDPNAEINPTMLTQSGSRTRTVLG